MRIVHSHFEGAEGTIVFAHTVDFGRPSTVARTHRAGVGIGAVDETVVGPEPPRVDNNPGTALIVVFAGLSVAVKIKFDAIVIAYDGEGMVDLLSPRGDVFLSDHTGSLVGIGVGDFSLGHGRSHTDTEQATGMEVGVAVMVPQPVFRNLATFGRVEAAAGKACGPKHTVVHGFKPLVVARHPPEVVLRFVLRAKEGGVGAATIGRGRRHTYARHHLILTGAARSEQPNEVGGIEVVGHGGIEIAESVDFMGEHVADARSGAT